MALTLGQLKMHCAHAIPGGSSASLPPGTTSAAVHAQIINEAGRALYNAWPWKFKERPAALLNLTISTAYVALPSDFGELASLNYVSQTTSIELTDFDTLATLRNTNTTPAGFHYWAAIVQPEQTAQTSTLPVARLELYPTPTASVTGALSVMYRAAWRELSDDTHYAAIPLWAESLLVQYVRAFAEGYDDAGAVEGMPIRVLNVNNLVAEIEAGPLFQRATQKDMLTQPHYGVMTGGLVGSMGCGFDAMDQDQNTVAVPWIY